MKAVTLSDTRPTRVVHMTTVPLALEFLRGQLRFMKDRGFDPHVVSSPGELLWRFSENEDVPAHEVRMERRMSPLSDALSLLKLWRLLRKLRPDIVHCHTPKAGLLGITAGWMARVPVRIYHLHGLPALTMRGYAGRILRWAERVTSGLASHVLCVSPSLCAAAVQEGLCPESKISVPVNGSANGIDADGRFNPELIGPKQITELRDRLGLGEGVQVLGFVGRIVRDKGIIDLHAAWQRISKRYPNLHLLLVGPVEAGDSVPHPVLEDLSSDRRVHLTGWVDDVAPLYAVMDVLILPSSREGFPNAVLEAGAMGRPVVATRVVGCVDAVEDQVTGRLVPPHDDSALESCIEGYLTQSDLRRRHGDAGRRRVLKDFRQTALWEYIHETYRDHMASRRRRSSKPIARIIKRGMDLVVSSAALVMFSPVYLVLSLVIRILMGPPVFFFQQRAGRNGKPFELAKFRSMNEGTDTLGNLLPDDERLSPLGRFIRRTSLDELPSLWNVLRGEMSLVGPRPLHARYLERYTREQARRHEVRPGITGWAQVHGRNAISWERRLALDVWYVDHWSIALDLSILALTVWRVLRREGIGHEGTATMPEFMGSGHQVQRHDETLDRFRC